MTTRFRGTTISRALLDRQAVGVPYQDAVQHQPGIELDKAYRQEAIDRTKAAKP